jgi:GNAT superfamily N-acetyltransferase
MPQITVRRIGPEGGGILRDLRLRSLRDAPTAFGQTVTDAAARDDQDWQQQARQASTGDRRAWFIAQDDGARLVGLVQGRRRPPADLLIFSMWVDPDLRRSGVGRQLIDAVLAWSRSWGGGHSVLWVFGTNEPAIRFYRRLGFQVEHGTADAASGRTYGALAMSRSVESAPG